ncbi:MAG: hypothetical protein QW622_00335 [Candidatus Pacearchaeota archaeon]
MKIEPKQHAVLRDARISAITTYAISDIFAKQVNDAKQKIKVGEGPCTSDSFISL